MARTSPHPCLIDVDEAATLLSVSPQTVLSWIATEALPYVESPHPPKYRLPLHGLVRSLPDLYDLATEFREADDIVTDGRADKEPVMLFEALTSVAAMTMHAAELAPPIGAASKRARAVQRYYSHT